MKKPDLLLVGYGRFGRLAAKLLRARWKVHVLDRRDALPLPRGIARAKAADLDRFRVVIFAIPADSLRSFLGRDGRRIAPGTFVADLCAVKIAPMEWMGRFLGPEVSYAGLHPLFGPDSAAAGARGHRIVVCPGRLTPSCARKLTGLLRRMGLKPIETTPAIHDRAMASTLFLTQIVGTAAGAAAMKSPPFSTPAFNQLRLIIDRAAGNSGELVRELLKWNRYVPSVNAKFKDALLRQGR